MRGFARLWLRASLAEARPAVSGSNRLRAARAAAHSAQFLTVRHRLRRHKHGRRRGPFWSARFVTALSACNHNTIRLKEAGPGYPSAGVEHGNRTMFAVIKTGGKQYRVAEDQVIKIERIEGEPGTIVQLGDVLMLGGDTPQLGAPTIAGASVAAEVIEQGRGAKVIAFKKRRRKNSRRKRGHRQEFTLLRITEILTDGAKPTKGPKPKPEREGQAAAARRRGRGQAEGQEEAGQEADGRQEAQQPRERKSNERPAKTQIVAPAGWSSQRSSIFVR